MGELLTSAEDVLSRAEQAVRDRRPELLTALDDLPTPIYVTDARGVIRYFNRACIAFAGRTPRLGRDRWRVSWKLFTLDGAELPRELSPLAVAMRQKRPVRGVAAISQRPDGARIRFTPFPTPILDDDGELLGGANVVVSAAAARRSAALREQARGCRRRAETLEGETLEDDDRARMLLLMADDYDRQADALSLASAPAH